MTPKDQKPTRRIRESKSEIIVLLRVGDAINPSPNWEQAAGPFDDTADAARWILASGEIGMEHRVVKAWPVVKPAEQTKRVLA